MSTRQSREGSFKYIIRIANTDIDGNMNIIYGLSKIKGIGFPTALAITRKLGIDPNKRIGYLTNKELKELEGILFDLTKLNLPSWMYNRRRDYETGEDKHLIGADLIFVARRDVEREQKINSWRGVRHKLGLKVRGQRTHTTGRLGMTVGVKKGR
ncbi:MAG: 30S ribosomal protein S13 [Caldisphaeraceae archaeon]|nr:30S ribosomal protein S13 [Caldisphaeraceae archaeon]MEB3692174.1 30S ribosomal protein S13 [Caldisphaeraceae archaeon]MEB3797957.1 30S ribosomal protein S13 [Caldisphaeraceae archaeon]